MIANPFGCEIKLDCDYVLKIEDEKHNRVAFVYDKKDKILNVLNKKFDSLKIEYIPNEG